MLIVVFGTEGSEYCIEIVLRMELYKDRLIALALLGYLEVGIIGMECISSLSFSNLCDLRHEGCE
jgi:hypothetical protein